MTTELQPSSSLTLNLADHQVEFVLPAEGNLAGNLSLNGGAIIAGNMRGRITCKTGAVIITRGAEFYGLIEADRIYVEGKINTGPAGEISTLKGQRLIAISEFAEGRADLVSEAFSIYTTAFTARLKTLERQA